MSDLARCLTASRCWGNENHEPCETRHISRAVGLAGAPFLPHRRPVLLLAPAPPACLPARLPPPPPFPTAASGRRMRRERSIFEAFLTKIKPTIFCLVSKALPLPRLAPAFPTGQCGVRLYHRGDLADCSRSLPIPSASTPGERGLKDRFENLAPICLILRTGKVSNTSFTKETHTHILCHIFSRFLFCLNINIVTIVPLRHPSHTQTLKSGKPGPLSSTKSS